MKNKRAIYIGDVRFDTCPVFEYEEKTDDYIMLIDREVRYSSQAVEEIGSGFIVFQVEGDFASLIKLDSK